MTQVSLCYSDDMLLHAPDGYDPRHPDWTEMVKARLGDQDEGGMRFTHPERPERLAKLIEILQRQPIEGVDWYVPEPADHDTLSLVHDPAHIAFIESHRGKSGWLHHDTTAVSEYSVHAAETAVGAACLAVDQVVANPAEKAFALVRPPGHHAYPDKSRGFCIYNNVAVAAMHARKNLGIERVLIVDWDAHHGNGTQAAFLGDPDVMHFDMHASAPTYPGSGALFDTGKDSDRGTIINVPVPPKTGDAVFIEAIENVLIPAALRFRPDLIIVSAGFDGHRSDLLLDLSEQGFAAMTSQLLELAELLCDGRIAFVLEGGYREALGVSVRACLEVLAGNPAPEVPLGGPDPGREALKLAAVFHNRPVY